MSKSTAWDSINITIAELELRGATRNKPFSDDVYVERRLRQLIGDLKHLQACKELEAETPPPEHALDGLISCPCCNKLCRVVVTPYKD
jgi:hypothetical protein